MAPHEVDLDRGPALALRGRQAHRMEATRRSAGRPARGAARKHGKGGGLLGQGLELLWRRRPLSDLNSGIRRQSEGHRPQVIERDALGDQVPSDRVEYVGDIGRQSLLHPQPVAPTRPGGRMTVGTRWLLAEFLRWRGLP